MSILADLILRDPNIAPEFKDAFTQAAELAEYAAEKEAQEREDRDEWLREKRDAERARYGYRSGE